MQNIQKHTKGNKKGQYVISALEMVCKQQKNKHTNDKHKFNTGVKQGLHTNKGSKLFITVDHRLDTWYISLQGLNKFSALNAVSVRCLF